MSSISYSEARDRLASVWDETVSTREPVLIDRRGHESVVIVPAAEWESLVETAYLLRSPANAKRLLGALHRSEAGEGEVLTVEELAAKVGLK